MASFTFGNVHFFFFVCFFATNISFGIMGKKINFKQNTLDNNRQNIIPYGSERLDLLCFANFSQAWFLFFVFFLKASIWPPMSVAQPYEELGRLLSYVGSNQYLPEHAAILLMLL